MTQKQILPTSLWKFYLKYAFPGYGWIIFFWAIISLIMQFDNVLFPFYQKWLVQALETPIPDGMTWLQHILPTIILIVVLDISLMLCLIMRWFLTICCSKNINTINKLYPIAKYVLVGVAFAWQGKSANNICSTFT